MRRQVILAAILISSAALAEERTSSTDKIDFYIGKGNVDRNNLLPSTGGSSRITPAQSPAGEIITPNKGAYVQHPAIGSNSLQDDARDCAADRNSDKKIQACFRVINSSLDENAKIKSVRDLSNFYFQSKDIKSAIDTTNKGLVLYAKSAMLHLDRGFYFEANKEYENSISDYNIAIKLDPKFALAYSFRGNYYAGHGDLKAGMRDFNHAIDLNPNLATAYRSRAIVYRMMGDFEHSIADYDRAIKIEPGNMAVYASRNLVYDLQYKRDGKPNPIIVGEAGRDGLSTSTAVRLVSSEGSFAAIPAEYSWIQSHHPEGFQKIGQSLISADNKKIDRIDLKLPNGNQISYYFDVTAALGSPQFR
ncbi:tetratricopeptide repeat protein [Methylobacterium mesophilicum]